MPGVIPVLMPHFLHALTLITTDEGSWLAVVELIFTTLAFVGTIYYARLRGRAGSQHPQEERAGRIRPMRFDKTPRTGVFYAKSPSR